MADAQTSPHEEDALGKIYDARLMRRLLAYVLPYRGLAVGAVALIVVSSLLQLVGPLVTAVTIDLYVRPLDGTAPPTWIGDLVDRAMTSSGWNGDPTVGVLVMAGIFLASLLATFVVLYAQSYLMQIMGQLIMRDLRRDIFARLQRLPPAYFDRHPIGRLVTRATTDVDSLNELFTAGLVSICGDLVLLFGILLVLFALDWRLALVSFAILPLLTILTLWFKIRARQSYREVRVQVARINSFLQEHISGMSIVQLFSREAAVLAEESSINDAHRAANIRAIVYFAVYYPLVELITAIGLALIVWYGGGRILTGALSVGALIAFLQYAQRFYRPLADLAEKYNVLQSAMASAERIFQLLDAELTIASPPDAHRPDRTLGRIEFEGVSFSYLPDEPVLRDISFRIEPGEMVAVVGHTGAGKSTLANLLLRFYDVDRGDVRIDDVDVRRWDLTALRGAIAMVQQDVLLFSGDIASNIHLGHPEIDSERVRRAAREVEALDLIERMPEGFASRLGERGAGLSVGQKQLISFARALAFDPRILILDEATASIDPETEHRIQIALDRLLEGRTSLVIAHRLSTIRRADRILVLHKGCLREEGTHEELLALGGIYHKLYLLQYQRGEELAAGG